MVRIRRRKASALVLLLALVTVFLLPSSSRALNQEVTLATTNEDWNRGAFLRTGLTSNEVGGVQILPGGVVEPFQAAYNRLPLPLVGHASVSYRDHLFVIGGATPDTVNPSAVVKGDFFFAARLQDATTGQLGSWTRYDNNLSFPGRTLPRKLTNPAAVVVTVGSRTFLYVLGGEEQPLAIGGDDEVTSKAIYRSELTTDASGNITPGPWQADASSLPQLPSFENVCFAFSCEFGGGVSKSAVLVHAVVGTPYIYMFGGLNRTHRDGILSERYVEEVWRAPVGGDGSIGQWVHFEGPGEQDDITRITTNTSGTVVTQTVRLAGAAASTFIHPETGAEAAYISFGRAQDPVTGETYLTEFAHVATFRADGRLSWQESGTMLYPLEGHDVVQSNGALFLAGGSSNASSPEPRASMAFAPIEDDGTLYQPPDPRFTTFQTFEGALLDARVFHTMETIPTAANGTWFYVMAGRRQTTSGGQTRLEVASDEILIGQVGQDESVVQNVNSFQPIGAYYSQVFEYDLNTAYEQISWDARSVGISQTLTLGYRSGDEPNNLGSFKTIQQTSINGANTFVWPAAERPEGKYFQFMATLETGDRTQSPVLDNVRLLVNRPGFPNLRVESARFTPAPIHWNSTILPEVTIANRAYPGYPALDANVIQKGFFYADIYVIPPGGEDARPVMGDIGAALTLVNKDLLPAEGSPYAIPPSSWRRPWCPESTCPEVDWREVFDQQGTYTVYVMVDSTDRENGQPRSPMGEVPENNTNTPGLLGESDNVFGPFSVEVADVEPTPTPTDTPTGAPDSTATTQPDGTATTTATPTGETPPGDGGGNGGTATPTPTGTVIGDDSAVPTPTPVSGERATPVPGGGQGRDPRIQYLPAIRK